MGHTTLDHVNWATSYDVPESSTFAFLRFHGAAQEEPTHSGFGAEEVAVIVGLVLLAAAALGLVAYHMYFAVQRRGMLQYDLDMRSRAGYTPLQDQGAEVA